MENLEIVRPDGTKFKLTDYIREIVREELALERTERLKLDSYSTQGTPDIIEVL